MVTRFNGTAVHTQFPQLSDFRKVCGLLVLPQKLILTASEAMTAALGGACHAQQCS